MKDILSTAIAQAIEQARADQLLAVEPDQIPPILIEVPRDPAFGDHACTIAMQLAKPARTNPRVIAEAIRERIEHPWIDDISIAGPGFLNFRIAPGAWTEQLGQIIEQGADYGRSTQGNHQRAMVEFVSANPTGPLHIGHGRGAAVGDSLARLLDWAGYDVSREYYINDAGNQMHNLGRSTWIRLQQIQGETAIELDENCYQGSYITEIARDALAHFGPERLQDPESAIALLGQYTGQRILDGIAADLATFNVQIDHWFSERSLHESNQVNAQLERLLERDEAYESEGALWVRTTAYGDDKDRVVRRSNDETTYFAADIAYHADKFNRGFEQLIDVWGADHHGYVPRMKAAIQSLGHRPEDLEIVLIQLVNLMRDGEPLSMSTRRDTFVTLREVLDEVGADATRYFFLMRHQDSKLDFDLELAKKQTSENPVYYVQYCHARCCSIIDQLRANRQYPQTSLDAIDRSALQHPAEQELIKILLRLPATVVGAAQSRECHRIPHFLNDVASAFHSFYTECRVMGAPSDQIRDARALLVECTRQVVANGLGLLGVSAPERM